MSKFTDNLDILLREKGITRTQLLKELKLGKNSFVNWNSRDSLPSGDTLVKLADYFDVTLDQLIGREHKKGNI